ncbi:MAG: RtcB family protein [Verrucomicrobia bacterium]|nr:RtcB family protein [Verrucomicrobiota bacterium]
MKKRELINLGISPGAAMDAALAALRAAVATRLSKRKLHAAICDVTACPEEFVQDKIWGALARSLISTRRITPAYVERARPAAFEVWGDDLDPNALAQMRNACRLPVSALGALMPDAHVGYGLPIGGVLATRNAVIPYAVGVDIACRMKMTVLDMPVSLIRGAEGQLRKALDQETSFGIGAAFTRKKDHAVLEEDWSVSPVTRQNRDKAWRQLGTSGSGNHFVEFGSLTLPDDDLGLKAGTYFTLLSHSGSRGTGASVAQHYSRLAMDAHPELPRELKHLAWLDLTDELGQEYWAAMELMGKYAAANHALIHQDIARMLKAKVLLDIENHHNFAWKEVHDGEAFIVHRKGATPAGNGAIGVIPGTMATPGFVVRGKGNPGSLNSASHGAGRAMSRTQSKNSFTWHQAKAFLRERDVILISAGLDEVPMAYKDIETVMAAQTDLVDIIARFDPKLVKMAPEGERPED